MDWLIVQDLNKKSGLPIELIQIILRYTYSPQPNNLLVDIQNYSSSLIKAKDQYFDYWYTIEDGDHLSWLENDIILYANANRPTNLGSHLKMQDIINRSFMSKKLKAKPIYNNYKLNVRTVINIFWGLFTITERNDFILNKFN